MSTIETAYGALGAVAVATGTYLAAKLGARTSKHATDTTADLTKQANTIAEFRTLMDGYRGDLAELKKDGRVMREEHLAEIRSLREDHAGEIQAMRVEHTSEVTEMQRKHTELRAEHDDLRKHVQTLERERRRDKELIRYLVVYVRKLMDTIRQLGQPVPEAPAGLDLNEGPLTS